jgi:putative ABC transport system substrate-binding protein
MAAYAGSVTVLYPDVKPAYRQLFAQIIEGIESEAKKLNHTPVKPILLPKGVDRQEVAKEVFDNPPDMVISLGKRAYGIAQILEGRVPVVTGAVPISQNSIVGVSLIVDPDVIFGHLTDLAPSVKNIFVVYSPRSEWLINLAKKSAASRGYRLHAYSAGSVKSAAQLYQKLIHEIDPKTDAFWLPLDSITSNDQVVLPMMLEAAWNKKFVVFSSKPFHAKRGVLFSPVPDQRKMGRRLMQMVSEMSSEGSNLKVEPLRDVLLAVNVRTASHLNIKYNATQLSSFDFIFPASASGR